MGALGGGWGSYERGNPVETSVVVVETGREHGRDTGRDTPERVISRETPCETRDARCGFPLDSFTLTI